MRWVVETGWASLLMNYDDMWKGGEARAVLVKLQDSMRTVFGDLDSHTLLVSWGELIRVQFKTDNLPITARLQHYPDIKPLVDVVSDLSAQYVAQQQIMLVKEARQLARDNRLAAENKLILEKLDRIERTLELQGDGTRVRPDEGKSSVDPVLDGDIVPPPSPVGVVNQPQANMHDAAGSSSTQSSLSLTPARSECLSLCPLAFHVHLNDIVYMFTYIGWVPAPVCVYCAHMYQYSRRKSHSTYRCQRYGGVARNWCSSQE